MDKKTINGNTGYAALPGLDMGQLKLLCQVAYLGDIPGDYVLKQLYGRNCSARTRHLGCGNWERLLMGRLPFSWLMP